MELRLDVQGGRQTHSWLLESGVGERTGEKRGFGGPVRCCQLVGILEIVVNTREDSGLWQTLDVVVLCSLVEWSAARHFLVSGRFFSTLPVSPRQLQEGDCPEEGEDQGAVVGRKSAGDD